MRKILTALPLAGLLLVVACGDSPELLVPDDASPASVHLKGGKNAAPDHNDGGLFLQAFGSLSGLGFADVVVSLAANADVASTCTNQGGTAAPGQNPAPLVVTGSVAIPAGEFKNGNTPFDVRTVEPDPTIAGAPGCPNPNWTESIDDLSFTDGTITVEQPAGNVVLTVSCVFTPATVNGAVPRNSAVCSQS